MAALVIPATVIVVQVSTLISNRATRGISLLWHVLLLFILVMTIIRRFVTPAWRWFIVLVTILIFLLGNVSRIAITITTSSIIRRRRTYSLIINVINGTPICWGYLIVCVTALTLPRRWLIVRRWTSLSYWAVSIVWVSSAWITTTCIHLVRRLRCWTHISWSLHIIWVKRFSIVWVCISSRLFRSSKRIIIFSETWLLSTVIIISLDIWVAIPASDGILLIVAEINCPYWSCSSNCTVAPIMLTFWIWWRRLITKASQFTSTVPSRTSTTNLRWIVASEINSTSVREILIEISMALSWTSSSVAIHVFNSATLRSIISWTSSHRLHATVILTLGPRISPSIVIFHRITSSTIACTTLIKEINKQKTEFTYD